MKKQLQVNACVSVLFCVISMPLDDRYIKIEVSVADLQQVCSVRYFGAFRG